MNKEVKRGEFSIGPEWFGIEAKSEEHKRLLNKLAKAAMSMGLGGAEFETYSVKEGLEQPGRPVGAKLPVMKEAIGRIRVRDIDVKFESLLY